MVPAWRWGRGPFCVLVVVLDGRLTCGVGGALKKILVFVGGLTACSERRRRPAHLEKGGICLGFSS